MNDHIAWQLMPSYVLRLVDMATALHKPCHKSRNDLIQPLLDYDWLTCIRKTEHNAWYELTDKGQQVVYRLLCNYFERSMCCLMRSAAAKTSDIGRTRNHASHAYSSGYQNRIRRGKIGTKGSSFEQNFGMRTAQNRVTLNTVT